MHVIPYKSKQLGYVSGSTVNVSFTEFLEAAKRFDAPVLGNLRLRLHGVFSTGAAGLRAKIAPQIISNILLRDSGGPRVSVDGAGLRLINQMEFGWGFRDGQDIAATQGATVQEQMYRIPFYPPKSRRYRDYGISIQELLDGGSLQITWSGAATVDGATGGTPQAAMYVEILADIWEERTLELKSRMVWLQYAMNQQDTSYPVGGRARAVLMYCGAAAEQLNTALVLQNITSRTNDIAGIPSLYFVDYYKSDGYPVTAAPGTAQTHEDSFVQGYAVPIVSPRRDQKIPQMSEGNFIHIASDTATVAGQQLYICSITERVEQNAVRVMKAASSTHLEQALAVAGSPKLASGKTQHISKWPESLRKHFPLRVRKVFIPNKATKAGK